MAPRLLIIVGSSRPGALGPAYGRWMAELARRHGGFDVSVVDLAELDLPFFDEPRLPVLGGYAGEHTQRWSRIVGEADAFVIVTGEYNHSFSSIIKNALDFLGAEWKHKPVGFLAYGGGMSAGSRAVEALLHVTNALRMFATPVSVLVPYAHTRVGDDGEVTLPPETATYGEQMLNELAMLSDALKPAREAGA